MTCDVFVGVVLLLFCVGVILLLPFALDALVVVFSSASLAFFNRSRMASLLGFHMSHRVCVDSGWSPIVHS